MPNAKPPYPPEFRAEAVRLVRSSDRSIADVADDLGVAHQTLRNWVFQARVDDGLRIARADGVERALADRAQATGDANDRRVAAGH